MFVYFMICLKKYDFFLKYYELSLVCRRDVYQTRLCLYIVVMESGCEVSATITICKMDLSYSRVSSVWDLSSKFLMTKIPFVHCNNPVTAWMTALSNARWSFHSILYLRNEPSSSTCKHTRSDRYHLRLVDLMLLFKVCWNRCSCVPTWRTEHDQVWFYYTNSPF